MSEQHRCSQCVVCETEQRGALTHEQGLAIAKALRGEISHGKLAELLGIKDVHAFKQASGSFEDIPCPSCDTFRASLDAAQAEIAWLKDAVMFANGAHLAAVTERGNAEDALAEAEAELARLQGYVQHKADCDVTGFRRIPHPLHSEGEWVQKSCTCGLLDPAPLPKEPTT